MTKKHTERRNEARAEQAARKHNGATYHDPSYFTGEATVHAPEGKEGSALGGAASQSGEKIYTGEELRSIVRHAYHLGYVLGHRNQRDRLQRAGDRVGRLKAALILSNTALAQSTAALVD